MMLMLAAIPWLAVIIIAVILIVVLIAIAALVWAIVKWRRKRRAAAPPQVSGPSVGNQLRALWRPFYRRLPAQALHYPTVVVLGDAGVGKTHAISCHVDWRGQANQFLHSVDHGAAIQLYLGPDVVVHELSAPLLRDVGSEVKRALQSLWRHMGPSATVVLALDARTLLTTPPAALRELAQLVRGKISLFPQRCRNAVEVRVTLSHLDQIDGYDEFAAAIGIDYGALELSPNDPGQADAARLVATFDAHLANALTSRTGPEFDRMIRFYGVLPQLVAGLSPLLEALAAKNEPFARCYPASGLYLGSLVPRGQVGEPFSVARSQIAGSMKRQRRRGRRGSITIAACLAGGVAGLLGWHGQRVRAAADAVEQFEWAQDQDNGVNAKETAAGNRVVSAIAAMQRSEILWFAWTFQRAKRQVDQRFEQAIRAAYLEPRLQSRSRVELLYVSALIYASRDNDLGRVISNNRSMWADELELSEWVIETYIDSSTRPYNEPIALPPTIEQTGREWSDYLLELEAVVSDERIAVDEAATLRKNLPVLRTPRQYQVLDEIRRIMEADATLHDRLRPLLSGSLDSWAATNHDQLESLQQTILALKIAPGETKGWGLPQLVTALKRKPSVARPPAYTLEIGRNSFASEDLDAVIVRSQRHELIAAVIEQIDNQRPEGGRELFSAGARLPAAGIIKGYGGGPTRRIAGIYTKAAFDNQVAPVLRFAGEELAEFDLIADDRRQLAAVIRTAGNNYAAGYRQELLAYYESFEFDAGSEVALPFVIKPFAQPTSWFTEFLSAFAQNAALELPTEQDDKAGYFAAMRRGLAEFAPIVALLAEDGGAIPGLEPYQALMAALQKQTSSAVGQSGDPEATDLKSRLSALGSLALGTATGVAEDYEELVAEWLFGAGLDPAWYRPFLAPVTAVHEYGLLDIRTKVATAWLYDVRPVVDPLLDKYPFDPSARDDANVEELEAIVRMSGKQPGEFWAVFDQLIRPAMLEDRYAMIPGVTAPGGMLAMAADLEHVAQSLWDDKGERVALEVVLTIQALPKPAFDGRVAAMTSIGSSGTSIYGFNQRPAPQTIALTWWARATSVVLLEMAQPESGESEGEDKRRYHLVRSGNFSFYRLLDLARSRDLGSAKTSLSEAAIARATRCNRRGRRLDSAGVTIAWPVPMEVGGKDTRNVSVVLNSDPWAAFAVRRCR